MATEKFSTILDTLEKYRDSETIALICGEEKITYRELIADSKHIARGLLSEGVKKGERVLFCMRRTANAISGLLGILYAGASYVAADSDWPQERLKFIEKDAQTIFSITDETCKLLRDKDPISVEFPKISGEDEAAFYYTSGSTGKPKGAVLHHITFGSKVMDNTVYGQTWKIFQVISKLSFVVAMISFCFAFSKGRTILLSTDNEQSSLELSAASMKQNHADAVIVTPSIVLRFLENPDFARVFFDFKYVSLGGEKVLSAVADKIAERTNASIFINYGSSEMFYCATYCYRNDGNIRLGKAAHGVELYVLNENLEKILPGEEGELFIGGTPAKYGHYLNRPDLDAEKYFEHPKFGRLFRTGDIARFEKDGEITILGRKDGMIKLHGQRIEIGEVENVMSSFFGIKRAAVKLIDESPHEFLAAYYTCSEEVSETDLRKYLAERLPYYMMPSIFVKLDSMPENANGKLNYLALPQPEIPKSEYVSPETECEKLLCEIFSDVLKVKDPVDVNDNFFALGGDSINAMIVASRLREKGYILTTNHLFDTPTAGQLAPLLTPVAEKDFFDEIEDLPELSTEQSEKIEKNIGWENVECVYPVTDLVKESLECRDSWLIYKLWEINSSSILPVDLKSRLAEMTAKRPALRSVFLCTDTPLQVVLREHTPDFFWLTFVRFRKVKNFLQDKRHIFAI